MLAYDDWFMCCIERNSRICVWLVGWLVGMIGVICRNIYVIMSTVSQRSNASKRADRRRQQNARSRGDRDSFSLASSRHADDGEAGASRMPHGPLLLRSYNHPSRRRCPRPYPHLRARPTAVRTMMKRMVLRLLTPLLPPHLHHVFKRRALNVRCGRSRCTVAG